MAAKKATKRKPRKVLEKVVAKKAIADINALIKTRRKLDLELRKIEKHLKKMMGHHYFS